MTRWIPILVIADFVFLPMLHFQGIPFKFGYLLFFGYLVTHAPLRGFAHQLAILFGLLAVVTAISWVVFAYTNGAGGFQSTSTILSTYVMAAAAVVFGAHTRMSMLRYIPMLMIAYLAANIAVTIFWADLVGSRFGDLYGYVPNYLGTGTKLIRAGGLHMNPNVSARFMSVLLLGLFVGIRYGEVKLWSPVTILALVAGLGLPFIVASRSEMLTSLIILTALAFVILRRERRVVPFAIGLAGAVAAGLVAVQFLAPGVSHSAKSRLESAVRGIWTDPLNSVDGLGRPINAWSNEALWARVSESPVIGSSGEGIWYHNDWATILAGSGAIGMGLFLLVAFGVARVHVVFMAPLLVSATTNIFIFSPQHFTLFMLFVGIAWCLKYSPSQSVTETVDEPPTVNSNNPILIHGP